MSEKTILLIEDHPELRSACARTLQDRFPHYAIKTANNYVDGCLAAEDESVVAVITDNVMPRSDASPESKAWARAICSHIIRRRDSAIPLYVYSSEVSAADRTALQEMMVYVSNGKEAAEFSKIMDGLQARLSLSPLSTPSSAGLPKEGPGL